MMVVYETFSAAATPLIRGSARFAHRPHSVRHTEGKRRVRRESGSFQPHSNRTQSGYHSSSFTLTYRHYTLHSLDSKKKKCIFCGTRFANAKTVPKIGRGD